MVEPPVSRLPPWNWSAHDPAGRADRWRAHATWVRWLEGAYNPWVILPACWPDHEGLVAELRVFWYWHLMLNETDGAEPEEVVRWHRDLRSAAQFWTQLASCSHDAPISQQTAFVAQRNQRVSAYVDTAIHHPRGTA